MPDVDAAPEGIPTINTAELRQETQAAQRATRTMVRAAWLMAIMCLAALSGAVGAVVASFR